MKLLDYIKKLHQNFISLFEVYKFVYLCSQVEEELREQELIEQCFEDLYEMEIIASEILSSSPLENAFITFDSSHSGLRTVGMALARQEHSVATASQEEVVCVL